MACNTREGVKCCKNACKKVISRIEVDVAVDAGAFTTYDFTIGKSMQQAKCFIPLHIGDTGHSSVYQWDEVLEFCDTVCASLKDLSIVLTFDSDVNANVVPFEFPCTPRSVQAMVEYSVSSTVHTYYWETELYLEPSFDASYKCTPFTFDLSEACATDEELAVTVKAALVAALGGSNPEFATDKFEVAIIRNPVTSGSPLGLAEQEYFRSNVIESRPAGTTPTTACGSYESRVGTVYSAAVYTEIRKVDGIYITLEPDAVKAHLISRNVVTQDYDAYGTQTITIVNCEGEGGGAP